MSSSTYHVQNNEVWVWKDDRKHKYSSITQQVRVDINEFKWYEDKYEHNVNSEFWVERCIVRQWDDCHITAVEDKEITGIFSSRVEFINNREWENKAVSFGILLYKSTSYSLIKQHNNFHMCFNMWVFVTNKLNRQFDNIGKESEHKYDDKGVAEYWIRDYNRCCKYKNILRLIMGL